MENMPILILICFFTYYIIIKCLTIYDANKQRAFELKREKIRFNNRFVVAPFVSNLLEYLSTDAAKIDNEIKTKLVEILQGMLTDFNNDTQDVNKLDEVKIKLMEIINDANLAADLVIKIQQIINLL